MAGKGEFACDEVEHGGHVLDGTVATGPTLDGKRTPSPMVFVLPPGVVGVRDDIDRE